MTLQNRVDPFGNLHAVEARGLFTGNRGVIHDPETKRLTGRRWTTKAWIVCVCAWQGRRRDVWGRNGPKGRASWTELFLPDEVTALAAGHRPCFYCRRADAIAFRDAFAKGNRLQAVTAPQMDARLHAERRLSARTEPRPVSLDGLPDGTVIEAGGVAFARRDGQWLHWSFEGYTPQTPKGATYLITPSATIAALRAGYRPLWSG
ncbi:hypothetical protein [Aliihoeflea sp. PC F10.4]